MPNKRTPPSSVASSRLLEKYRLTLDPHVSNEGWYALAGESPLQQGSSGPTPAIAICRAVVALHESRPTIVSAEAPSVTTLRSTQDESK